VADEKTWQRAVHTGTFGVSYFLSVSDIKTLARGETDIPSRPADWFFCPAGNTAEGRLLNLNPDFRRSLRRK